MTELALMMGYGTFVVKVFFPCFGIENLEIYEKR